LEITRELDRPTFGRISSELMSVREPLPFLGDSMFYALARALIDVENPLIREFDTQLDWPRRPLELTGLGKLLLDGTASWVDHTTTLWIGGVRIEPGRPH